MMIQFLNKFYTESKSAFLHGKAFRKIARGNYLGGAKILEELCEANEDEDNIEYSFYRLGHCYYALGNYKKAINWFSRSHNLYRKNVTSNSDQRYLKCYQELVDDYCSVLKRDGKIELAKQIRNDLQKIS